ncbi:CaiB/BaiF CoA-transferase family protein [Advenella sp. FME57]|uniref:CaiB/BaiF CoA transferase family protein n=1 Tax=Advenella sp. FME57 TaxID=2742604 RepID=UPI0018660F5F|nr:CoA transferase [Advenella sp. FME57]
MLSGFRVLDFTWVLGGPFASQLLAQLGAEVIKVEPLEGDLSRRVSSHSTVFEGDSGFFLSVNRGKSSIALDLKSEQGREVLYDLVRESDAIIYGFAPDVPKRLGLDKKSLLAVNPKIAIGQLIGLHDKGPFAKAPAFDLVVQAMSGVMSITGNKDSKPVRLGYQAADLTGGLYLALGCVGLMLKALKSGIGDLLQVSLLDCQLAMLTWQAQNYFISDVVPKANGARHPVIAPSDIYPCADEQFIALSPTGQQFWESFCEAIGREDLANDSRFDHPVRRIENVESLTQELNQVFQARKASDWAAHLFEQRVPAALVNNIEQATSQPLVHERNMVEELIHPRTQATLRFLGNPFKFEGAESTSYPPAFGEHTRKILSQVCGYEARLIDQLIKANVIFQGDVNDQTE